MGTWRGAHIREHEGQGMSVPACANDATHKKTPMTAGAGTGAHITTLYETWAICARLPGAGKRCARSYFWLMWVMLLMPVWLACTQLALAVPP